MDETYSLVTYTKEKITHVAGGDLADLLGQVEDEVVDYPGEEFVPDDILTLRQQVLAIVIVMVAYIKRKKWI